MNKAIKASVQVRVIMSCLVVLVVYIYEHSSLMSSLLGVLACLIPESYQAWKLSKTEKEFEPSRWLRLTYQSMISKWLMTAMIFAIGFSSAIDWDYKILFIGYVVVSISGLLTPLLIGKK